MRRICIIILCFCVYDFCIAQNQDDDYASGAENDIPKKDKNPLHNRWVWGGNLGGFVGEVSFVQVSPMLGYRLTENFTSGVGLNYILATSQGLTMNVVGGSVWSRYKVFSNLYLHSEFEQLQISAKVLGFEAYRANAPVFMLGGGYLQGNFGVTILYDFIQDPDSPYQTPVIRIGGLFTL
jgi:hypothetical protein